MKKDSSWRRYMLFPFSIGVILHLLVPIQFIHTSNPKIQEAYKTYSIERQQGSIRAVSLENALVFENSLQMYENMRAAYLRLYQNPSKYQRVNLSHVSLNNAYKLTQMSESQYNDLQVSKSMWYMPEISNTAQMNSKQKEIYEGWAKLQPFILATLLNKSEIYQGFESLKTTISKDNQTFYIQYPSFRDDRFSTLNENLLSENYNETVYNYQNNQIWETIFAKGECIEICEPLLENEEVIGVSCLEISLEKFMKIPAFLLPEFDLSQTEYFLVKPQYPREVQPQVIMHFVDTNFSSLNFPSDTTFQNPDYLGTFTFAQQQDFQLYVHRYSIGHTSYVVPISTIDYNDQRTISLYFIALNHFITEDLDFQGREKMMLLSTLIPSCILWLVSLGCTTFVLRWMLNHFSTTIQVLNEYCSHIIRGDLDIIIPEHKEDSDLTHLFDQFRILNELQKYSNPHFFDVPKAERIPKYIRCCKLFDKLGYKTDGLCENIADCYFSLKQFTNSLKYMQISLDKSLKEYEEKYGAIRKIFKKKITRQKMSSRMRKMEKVLMRKVNKLIHSLYFLYTHEESCSKKIVSRIKENIDLIQKIAYPQILNIEYLSSMMIELQLDRNQNRQTESLERIGNLLDIYIRQQNSQNIEKKIRLDALEGSWWFIRAEDLLRKKKIMEAFWHYVQSMEYNYYDPHPHLQSHKRLELMLSDHGISEKIFQNMYYFRNYKKRQDREYIFLIDTCRPQLSEEVLNSWKNHYRYSAQYIFNKFVKDEDRISILQFCEDLKVNINLTFKSSQPRLLRRELMNSIRTSKKQCVSHPETCFEKTIKRVAHLKSEKWFIIFMKPGVQVDGLVISQMKKKVPNSEFIFLMENPSCMLRRDEGYYVLDLAHEQEDLERILEQKQRNPSDFSLSVF